ncbi:MAG: peptidylprolyl isomerase [Caulobacteraceae bacterium]
MLRFFRGFTKSWFGPAIMGLLVIAFGFLGSGGIRSIFGGPISDAVVQAGSRTVTPTQFQKLFQRQEQAYQERSGQPFPLEQALQQGVDKDMLQNLAAPDRLFRDAVALRHPPHGRRCGVGTAAPGRVGPRGRIAQIFDSITGKFKPEGLAELLKNNGITMAEFQRELSDSIADNDFNAAISEGYQAPRIFAAIQATLALEARDVTYFVIPASSVPVPPKPTDAQLVALMQQHREQLMLPERRRLTIVRFSAKAMAPTLTIDPAAVQQQFEAKKASYGKPELRSFVEIPLHDPTEAPAVIAALNKGQDPAAVAKSIGVDAVTYTDQAQTRRRRPQGGRRGVRHEGRGGERAGPGRLQDRRAEDDQDHAGPGARPGRRADPDRGGPAPVAGARQGLRPDPEVRRPAPGRRRRGRRRRQAGPHRRARRAGCGGRQGSAQRSVDPMLSQSCWPPPSSCNRAATATSSRMRTPTSPNQKGEYYVVHVDQVVPPSLPSLDEPGIRPGADPGLHAAGHRRRAAEEGRRRPGGHRQGAARSRAVATANGATLAHQVGLQRAQAQQYAQTFGQPFLQVVFGAKSGQVFSVGSDPLKGLGDRPGRRCASRRSEAGGAGARHAAPAHDGKLSRRPARRRARRRREDDQAEDQPHAGP